VRSDDPVIRLIDVTKAYVMGDTEVKALQRISIRFLEGEMVAIVGTSGSGKSTLLNIIGCLDRPSEGTYLLDGESVRTLDERRLSAVRNQKVGFVFQSFNLLPRVSALKNVELPLMYAKVRDRRYRAKKALERVGLGHRISHRPTELSGGEQQRVSIARALVMEPRILLADEPTGNLDTTTSAEVMSLLQELNQTENVLVIIVTHDPEVASHCQRIVTLSDGLVISDEKLKGPKELT
jgi:putative ABC transport system ATP-binding protein